MSEGNVVVVGAGPAGVAMSVALSDAGVRPLVLDRAARVASSWRTRYDRLRLNTCRYSSHLPGRRFSRGTPMFPSRDQLIAHLEHHARDAGIEFRFNTPVERLDRNGDGWVARTGDEDVSAAQAVVATGYEGVPMIPDWEGRERFARRILHSSGYRNPAPFEGQAVLVVGPGCSGMEIAYDLATGGAAKVWLSARRPPNIVLREGPGGIPGALVGRALMQFPIRFADSFTRFGRRIDLGDLSDYGLPIPDEGVFTQLDSAGTVPSIVDREVIEAVKDGAIEVVKGVEALEEASVRLAGGGRVEPDAVVCATGYRRGLDQLVGHLGVLDRRGGPRSQGAEPAAPGLRFIGYTSRPGALGYMSGQARRAAKAIAAELRA